LLVKVVEIAQEEDQKEQNSANKEMSILLGEISGLRVMADTSEI